MIKKRKYTKTFVRKMERDLLRGGPDGGKMTYQQVADKYGVPIGSVAGTVSWLRKQLREAKVAKELKVVTKDSGIDNDLNALDNAFGVLKDATMEFIENSAKRVLDDNASLRKMNTYLAKKVKQLTKDNKKLIVLYNKKNLEDLGWKERAKKAFGNYE